jgi:ribose/xylose/arabinose/galactoside ABC-type transport system permease subunit
MAWLGGTGRREAGVLALLVAVATTAAIVNPAFLSGANLRDLLVQAAPVVIVGCGLTLVVLSGEIDISVGSLMGLLAAALGTLASPDRLGLPVGVAVALTLLLGTTIGAVNGFLVTAGRVPSIIVTLGMLTLLQGVTEIVMAGEIIQNLPPGLRFFGVGAWLGVPVALWTTALVFAACALLARDTPLGRRVYAVGGNEAASRLLGLPVGAIKGFAFTLTGFLTAVATLVSVPQLSVVESGIGKGFELLVVTCVVVGGTSIRGGKGSLTGTLLAALLLGTVGTMLIFLRLGEAATYWERAIQGGFILLAVLADRGGTRRGASPAAGAVP